MQRYNQAWNEYMADLERVVSAHKELYNQYKNIYADNNNYILPEIKIVNMVISTYLNDINIDNLKKDNNTEYYPKRFPGFVFRIHPRSTSTASVNQLFSCTD